MLCFYQQNIDIRQQNRKLDFISSVSKANSNLPVGQQCGEEDVVTATADGFCSTASNTSVITYTVTQIKIMLISHMYSPSRVIRSTGQR